MSKLRVHCFSVSLEGYGAGPRQDVDNPLGVGGTKLHEWLLNTHTIRTLFGDQGGEIGTDDNFAKRGFENIGAWILGRNMFGPVRGAWPDESWKGWWGGNPPYHTDVFVLTRHPRKSFRMEGDTSFHFVTDGIHSALEQARKAAKGKDVRLGGGVNTIRQYMQAKLVDEMHVAISPALLGGGEHLLHGIDLPALGYERSEFVTTPRAAHFVIGKAPGMRG